MIPHDRSSEFIHSFIRSSSLSLLLVPDILKPGRYRTIDIAVPGTAHLSSPFAVAPFFGTRRIAFV